MNDDAPAAVLTQESLAEALRVELRRALGDAGVVVHRNTIQAVARRVAQQLLIPAPLSMADSGAGSLAR